MKKLLLIVVVLFFVPIQLFSQQNQVSAIFAVTKGLPFFQIQNNTSQVVSGRIELIGNVPSKKQSYTVNMKSGSYINLGIKQNWVWLFHEGVVFYSNAGTFVWRVPFVDYMNEKEKSFGYQELYAYRPPNNSGYNNNNSATKDIDDLINKAQEDLWRGADNIDKKYPNSNSNKNIQFIPRRNQAGVWAKMKEQAERKLKSAERDLSNAMMSQNRNPSGITAASRVSTCQNLVNMLRRQVADYSNKELRCLQASE